MGSEAFQWSSAPCHQSNCAGKPHCHLHVWPHRDRTACAWRRACRSSRSPPYPGSSGVGMSHRAIATVGGAKQSCGLQSLRGAVIADLARPRLLFVVDTVHPLDDAVPQPRNQIPFTIGQFELDLAGRNLQIADASPWTRRAERFNLQIGNQARKLSRPITSTLSRRQRVIQTGSVNSTLTNIL